MYCLLILFAQQFTEAALFHSTARPGLNPYMREQKYFVGITWCNKNKNLSILYIAIGIEARLDCFQKFQVFLSVLYLNSSFFTHILY